MKIHANIIKLEPSTAVVCTWCGAKAGQPCSTKAGGFYRGTHRPRRSLHARTSKNEQVEKLTEQLTEHARSLGLEVVATHGYTCSVTGMIEPDRHFVLSVRVRAGGPA